MARPLIYVEKIQFQRVAELERLLDYFGTAKIAARELGFSRGAVQVWVKKKAVSKDGAIAAERYDRKFFKKEDIRPDISSW